MKRAEQAEQTRAKVVTTARRLFSEQGYDGTSLQLIADTMGVTKANVYYYFKTKAEILEAITAGSQRELAAVFDAAEKVRGRQARLEFVIDGFIDLVVQQRAVMPLNEDPGVRRQKRFAAHAEELGLRGLRLLFGDEPTVEEQAGYFLVSDLRPVLRRFPDLSPDELREVLRNLCLRVIPPARKADR
ncbi:helix-turn-helix domain-containing protein [Streptomyces sp. SID13031]|uniref:TetR/AcrR family transcriptional regulator n=1 Tax=Streptomyces sp. SID13031 TaxID=2706046 RepID=UPI0013C5D233|nr:helix-turn-helix domain-containing protein [Streptomyces sp. SID13031]NEA31458.1 TetR/AcrR family transcriptional regulator [Streptomyces sp. SID13031]